LKKKHNIKDEREDFYRDINDWIEALNGRPFLGGARPNLADLAVYGVLSSIESLQ
jgi:microsomal prostaglandin-E synthase 2